MTNEIKISNFSNEYIPQIVNIWNKNLPLDKTSVKNFVKMHICDLNFDSSLFLLALKENRLIGFVFGIKRKYPHNTKGLETDTAWIKLVVVDNDSQKCGIGSLLLHELENRFSKLGTKNIILAMYSPSYIYSGIDKDNEAAVHFFEKYGYIRKEASYWMERNLEGFQIPTSVLQKKNLLMNEGFIFENYHDEIAYSLLSMLINNFSTSWTGSVIDAIKNGKATDTIIICRKENLVVGYVSRASIDNNQSRFGPFGVSSDFRNYKLGEILINEMFKSMYEKGVYKVFFKSTEENGKRFYLRNGMEVKRTFFKYEKHTLNSQ